MNAAPEFRWTCSYLDSSWYEVRDASGTYEVEYRHSASAYARSIYNGTAEEFDRNCAPLVGWLHRSGAPIAQETLRAFNAWRRAEAERFNRDPRFRDLPADDSLRQPSHLAKGCCYWVPDPNRAPGDWKAGAFTFQPIEEEKEVA